LIKIGKINDIEKINQIISTNGIQIGDELIDITIYKEYKFKLEELKEYIEKITIIKNIDKSKSLSEINGFNNYDSLLNLKKLLIKLNNCEKNLFQINQFVDKKIDNDVLFESNELEKYLNIKNFNFIFAKENKPTFFYNNISIDLGVLIIDCHDELDIGSIIIHNNFNGSFSSKIEFVPSIESNENNFIGIGKNNYSLKTNDDLKIIFKKKEQKIISEGLKKSRFKIILYNNKEEYDYCYLDVYIFIMPLIIKFSLNTEKYNFNKKLKKNISSSLYR